jgi:hypothetical protein
MMPQCNTKSCHVASLPTAGAALHVCTQVT